MNINISTKYNIGDKVYPVDQYSDGYVPAGEFVVANINIKISKDDPKIIYMAKQGDAYDFVIEHLCFDTYAECAKWCKEHS